jgi:uncharacterized protein YbaP (TraB family)
MVWTVSDAAGSTAHLIGSIHTLTPDVYPLPTAMDDAFSASKVLVEEILLDEAGIDRGHEDAEEGRLASGRNAPAAGERLTVCTGQRARRHVGILMPMVRQLKPWMTAIVLSAATLSRPALIRHRALIVTSSTGPKRKRCRCER